MYNCVTLIAITHTSKKNTNCTSTDIYNDGDMT